LRTRYVEVPTVVNRVVEDRHTPPQRPVIRNADGGEQQNVMKA
jgi:hypothetical protein